MAEQAARLCRVAIEKQSRVTSAVLFLYDEVCTDGGCLEFDGSTGPTSRFDPIFCLMMHNSTHDEMMRSILWCCVTEQYRSRGMTKEAAEAESTMDSYRMLLADADRADFDSVYMTARGA